MLMGRWEKKEGGNRRFVRIIDKRNIDNKEGFLNYKDDSRTSREG